MFISILIPNYNNEKYLEECLESATKQTLSSNNYDITVLDDCSIDKSIDIIEKYDVKKIFLDRNVGLSKAREKLIESLCKKTTHIFFLDSDDSININCLEQLVKTTKEFPDKIACCGTVQNGKLKRTSKEGRLSLINTTQHSKLWPASNLKPIKWPSRLKNEDDYAIYQALNGKELKVNKKAIYYHRLVEGSLSTIRDTKNAKYMVDSALKNWDFNDRNLSILYHSVATEGGGKYLKFICRKHDIKFPRFITRAKNVGFQRAFIDSFATIFYKVTK